MLHQSLFVFDIETVPDTDAVYNLTGCKSDDVHELRKALEQYHLDITDGKNPFPRQPFHKVVAISFLEAEIHRTGQQEQYILKELRSGGKNDSDEKELVQGFFQHLKRKLPRLISFNGRGFDLPVLKYRAMVHEVDAGWLYNSGDKWNSYTSRYSMDWHCDLLESLSDFGASAKVKLNEVCSVLGIPGKVGVDGSKVTDMYDNNEIEAIRNYCETDVLNTYMVYLRYMQHRGTLSKKHYDEAMDDIKALLEREKNDKKYLAEFEAAWEESTKSLVAV